MSSQESRLLKSFLSCINFEPGSQIDKGNSPSTPLRSRAGVVFTIPSAPVLNTHTPASLSRLDCTFYFFEIGFGGA